MREGSKNRGETVSSVREDTETNPANGEDIFSSATVTDDNMDSLFQSPARPNQHRKPFSATDDEHVLETRGGLSSLTPEKFSDIFSNDNGLVDVEKERVNLVEEIRRLSSVNDPRLSNMEIKFLGDENRDYIRVIDRVTNDDMLIEKSPGLMRLEKESAEAKAQQRKQQQRKRPATELEQLSFRRPPGPVKLTRTRSGNQKASGVSKKCVPCKVDANNNNNNVGEGNSRDGWICYEDKFSGRTARSHPYK